MFTIPPETPYIYKYAVFALLENNALMGKVDLSTKLREMLV
jgi:hypothetical protein